MNHALLTSAITLFFSVLQTPSSADTVPPDFMVGGTIAQVSKRGTISFSDTQWVYASVADMRPILTGRYKLIGVDDLDQTEVVKKLAGLDVECGITTKVWGKNWLERISDRLTQITLRCRNSELGDVSKWLADNQSSTQRD